MARRILAFHSISDHRPRYAMSAIVLLAFALEFYHLDTRTFHGDELSSISEARNLGQNLNGILYFAIMHLWIRLGANEFLLRAPSALFAVATTVAGYRLVASLSDRATSLMASLLLATAPFVIEYGQLVRFYSLFLLTGTCAIFQFVSFVNKPSRWRLVFLAVADALAIGSHFFGLLIVLSQAVTWLILTKSLRTSVKLILVGWSAVTAAILIASRPLREGVYELMSRLTNPYGDPGYTGSRGLSIANYAKIPLTLFNFGLGENVYPLVLPYVPAALIVLAATGALGLFAMARNARLGTALTVSLFVLPLLLYLVLDPLSSRSLQGAAPRYLIFLLPLFYFVLAAGTQGKRSSYLLVPLLFVNAGGIASYWYGDWAYADDLVNWRGVRTFVGDRMTADTLLLLDGRAQETANYYFPASWRSENVYPYESGEDITPLKEFPRLIMLSYDFNSEPRARASNLIQEIEHSYNQTEAWTQYPLFIYVFDRKPSNAAGYPVDPATGNLTIPAEIYGLEFQDLRLPIPANVDGSSLKLGGAFSLPGPRQELVRAIPLEYPANVSQLYLLSNVTGTSQPQNGLQLATIQVTRDDGTVKIFPVRLGYETNEWDDRCVPGTCRPAYTWRKRLALLGTESYPGSWSEFDASIFSARFVLEPSTRVRSIELERVASPGTLNVWGIAFAP